MASPVDDSLVVALASGMSYEQAATACGLSKSTVVRRMRSRSFRAKLRRVRAIVRERGLSMLAEGHIEAIAVLRHIALSGTREAVRVNAARAILGAHRKAIEAEDLAAEVSDLREQVAALQKAQQKREQFFERAKRN